MLAVLDAAALRGWCAAGREALARARPALDALNVFPVPDGDTGTNLLLSFEAVDDAVRAVPEGPQALTELAGALSTAALLGARGNSGVLLSQLLRGVAEVLQEGPAGPAELRRALVRGAELARAAVAAPVEGTVLTVARAAAEAMVGSDLGAAVSAARQAGERAVLRTREQLPQLRDAGVVDAGGQGWVVLLQALEDVVREAAPAAAGAPAPASPPPPAAPPSRQGGPAYEVQYLLRATTEPAVAQLRRTLAGLGDSLAVVGGDGVWNVHVHVDDVGAALEAGLDAGRPYRVSVTRFADQQAPGCAADGGPPATAAGAAPGRRAVLAVADGAGPARLLAEAGALVVDGGPGAPPLAGALLAAVRASGARQVVVVAGGRAAGEVEQAAVTARAEGLEVELVVVGAAVQALAALAVSAPERGPDGVAAMREAAGGVRWGELRRAVATAETSAGLCLPGDVLAVVDGQVLAVGADPSRVARVLADRLARDAELLTVLAGSDAPAGLADEVAAHVSGARPAVHVVVVPDGPSHCLLQVGAE